MPINFTDKSLWNVANPAINNVNVATLGEINSVLNAAGVTVNYGSQGDLGKRIVFTEAEVANYTYATNGTLYGGIYQAVLVDSGATAANVARGKVAFLKVSGASTYSVTDQANADSVNLVAGVFLNSITPGNYGIIQVAGKVSVKVTTVTSHALGVALVVGATGDGTVDVATAPTVNNMIGNALVDPATTGTIYAAQTKFLFGRY